MSELDTIPVFVALLDEHGTIVRANRAAGRLLGRRPSALPGKPLATFVALEDRPAYRTSWAGLIAAGGEVTRTVRLRCATGTAACRLVLAATPEPLGPRLVRAVAVPLE